MSNTKIWAISILGLLCGWLIILSAPSVMPVVWAIFLAYFLHPLVLRIEKHLKIQKKILAVIVVLILILAVFIILINIILPRFINQMIVFARDFTGYGQQFMRLVDQLQTYLDGLGLDSRVSAQLDDILGQVFSVISNTMMGFVTTTVGLIFRFTDIVIISILLFYFLLDGPMMIRYAVDNAPATLCDGFGHIIEGLNGIIWGYMKNQVLISLITGLACLVAYLIFGLPFAVLLGILAAVLNMIPIFGSIISGVVASLVTLFYYDIYKALLIAAIVLVINMILGNIITPRLQAKTLSIHPVVVITALLVCSHLWGAVGMFVAVPLVGLGRLLLQELLCIIRNL